MSTRHHVRRWMDASRTRAADESLCGRAYTNARVLSPEDECPDDVTCIRCRKLQKEAAR